MTRPLHPRRKRYTPRRVLPPILGSIQFRGYDVLEEFEGVSALVLWFACRDGELSALTPERAELLSNSPATWGQLIENLGGTFASITPQLSLLSNCLTHDGRAVAAACDRIAEWSEEQGKLATAVEFAQVASLANPTHPMYAARAARILKERAKWAHAATWYDHAIFIARTVEDWYAYSDAYCGLGGLYAERGKFPRARKLFQRALRAAIRHHDAEQIANAYHYLFTLEAVAGNWVDAEAMAMRALAKYPPDSPKRPRLARDLAYRWILRGYFDRALKLAQEVLQHFSSPGLRTLVWSDIARAAAGAGEDEVFETAWAQAKVLLDEGVGEPHRITILLNLAHGAAFRGEGMRARLPASEALELARSRGEPQSVLEADALLGSLHGSGTALPRQPVESPGSDLAATVLRLLRESRTVT